MKGLIAQETCQKDLDEGGVANLARSHFALFLYIDVKDEQY